MSVFCPSGRTSGSGRRPGERPARPPRSASFCPRVFTGARPREDGRACQCWAYITNRSGQARAVSGLSPSDREGPWPPPGVLHVYFLASAWTCSHTTSAVLMFRHHGHRLPLQSGRPKPPNHHHRRHPCSFETLFVYAVLFRSVSDLARSGLAGSGLDWSGLI